MKILRSSNQMLRNVPEFFRNRTNCSLFNSLFHSPTFSRHEGWRLADGSRDPRLVHGGGDGAGHAEPRVPETPAVALPTGCRACGCCAPRVERLWKARCRQYRGRVLQ